MVRDVLALWSRLDPLRLDETLSAWLAATRDQVRRHRATSATRAFDYYHQFRVYEGFSAAWRWPDLHDPPSWLTRLRLSLIATGPLTIKRLTAAGMDPRAAADKAAPRMAAAASRHVLNGGRSVVDTMMRADPAAWGYQRVTDADPCAFCAMLASRGAVYLTAQSAASTLRDDKPEPYHDGCGCQTEPVFRPDTPLPPSAERFAELWATATAGTSGQDARRAFRRAYDATRPTP